MDQPQPLSKRIFSLSILALLLLINTLPTLAQQTRGILKGKVITAKNDPAENVKEACEDVGDSFFAGIGVIQSFIQEAGKEFPAFFNPT